MQELRQIPRPGCAGIVRRFRPQRVLLLKFTCDGGAFPAAFLAPDLFRFNVIPGFLEAFSLEFFNKHAPGKETVETLAAVPATPDPHAGGPVNQRHCPPLDQGFVNLVFRAADRLHACGQRTGLLIRHRKQRHAQVNHKSAVTAKRF